MKSKCEPKVIVLCKEVTFLIESKNASNSDSESNIPADDKE